ncbi:MAG: site-specific integrase, partial [Myxococcota bacterium]|nr:site-specific integrase [Myxococcota bacterium]
IASISAADLLAALTPIEKRGALETLHKTRQLAAQVFDYAGLTRGVIGNPGRSLKGALKRREQRRYKFLTRDELGPFLAKLGEYANPATAIALRLQLICATRPGELRSARWQEFDLAAKVGPVWRVPAERMKARREHVVPLPRQAVALLRELAGLQGSEPGALLFRSALGSEQAISENTLGLAIRRLGFDATAHGARHTFSTIANEDHLARPEVIEAALAHAVPGVAGRYNTAGYLGERRDLLQRWADLLDTLESAALGERRDLLQRWADLLDTLESAARASSLRAAQPAARIKRVQRPRQARAAAAS